MKLIPDAKRIFRRAWSVKASFAIAAINGFIVGFVVFGDLVPPVWFLSVNIILPVVVVGLRLIDQGLADGE